MRACFFTFLFLFTSYFTFSQNIRGKITDVNNNPLEAVNISIIDIKGGETSNKEGNYNISIKANRSYVIAFSFIGYQTEKIRIPMLKKGQEYILNIILKESNTVLESIIVKDQKSRKNNLSRIKTKHVEVMGHLVLKQMPINYNPMKEMVLLVLFIKLLLISFYLIMKHLKILNCISVDLH